MNAAQDVSPVHAARLDTIRRAIALIDTASPADLADYLAQTSLYDHIKADPGMLRQHLAATADDWQGADIGHRFGAWKAAQQLLEAAGQPY